MQKITSFSVPCLLLICAWMLLFSKKDLASSFIKGAGEGLKTTVSLMPGLVLMCTAAAVFTASGAGEMLSKLLKSPAKLLGIPSDILPFLTVRPMSGSASSSMLTELYQTAGVDSFSSFCASVIAGSQDTMFYIFALYFSAAGVKRSRYALPAGLFTMLAITILACALSRIFF